MRVVQFHHLRVALEAEEASAGALSLLFEAFPIASASGPVDITFRITSAGASPNLTGFRQTFKHGLKGFERSGTFLLVDGESHARISADGTRIDAGLIEGRDAQTMLFIALTIALRHHHLFHLHAGALVRGDGRRVLILGGSGAGKSTLTLSLLDRGSRVLGDDAVFLGTGGRLRGFPKAFHVGDETRAAFPALPCGPPLASGKRAVCLTALPAAIAHEMDAPDVLLFSEVSPGGSTVISRLSPADALGRALYSSAFAAVDGMVHVPEQLSMLRGVVDGARAFEVRIGSDWLADPRRAAANALP